MKKFWYYLEDLAGTFIILGYISYGLGIWDVISHTFPWSWTLNDIEGDWYTFVLGWLLIKLSKKIVKENELPLRSHKSPTNDDTSSEYANTEYDSLAEYIVADHLLNHHSPYHNDDHDET